MTMLQNLRYGMQGMQDGVAWRQDQQRRAADEARRAELEARADADYQRKTDDYEEDREQDAYDRENFELPEREARKASIAQQKRMQEANILFARAYARRDPTLMSQVYNEYVDDGYEAQIEPNPGGTYTIKHPNGSVVANNWDEVAYGKGDGTGMGIYQMINPEQVTKERDQRRTRAQQIEDDERNAAQRMREIGAQRQPTPQYGMDASGNTVLLQGANAVPVMSEGKPLRGATLAGRGGRMGGSAANPFGNSAESQRLWNGVQMARASDPSGRLAEMDDYEVAKMVNEVALAGKSRSERMKMATQLVRQAASGMGEMSTPQEIQERAEALVGVVDTMAGPQPTMPYSMDQSTSDMIPDPGMPTRKVVRRGMAPDGTRVVMFDDGSVEAE